MFAAANAEDVKLGGQEDTARPSCIEVTIDGQKAPGMSCLNQELERKAAAVPHVPIIPPVDARSASVQTGGFNQAAVAQQYGQNFGKSVEPYRPPAPVYAPPIAGH
ncbi:MAG TPA: hypothetical protein VFQ52_10390 [Rhizomicrobium sp.]|nr:hypothetical protein [Rhizomicrobium sp.]